MSAYYTHREYLKQELNKLDYEKKLICLEFGTGDGSGLIFKEYTDKYPNLTVISYETDYEWLEKCKNKYQNENYIFNYISSWDDLLISDNLNNTYDLVFVDQSPWEARIQTIDFIKNKSKIVILHDYDFYNKGVCDDIFSVNEKSFFYTKYNDDFLFDCHYSMLPPTLIMKNKKI
jgi:hypothetical protein